MDDLTRLDGLFSDVDKLYSGGVRVALEARSREVEEQLTDLEKAKRYRAYSLNQDIQGASNREGKSYQGGAAPPGSQICWWIGSQRSIPTSSMMVKLC